MAAKKMPMRMCVGCRVMRPKKEMLRVVRSTEGQVSIDPTGKAAGRGAYICKDIACLERAIKTRGLERAFEQRVEPELYETLKADFIKQYG
jgi:predicted RNA-binding protein YlxR (DUF448 family)